MFHFPCRSGILSRRLIVAPSFRGAQQVHPRLRKMHIQKRLQSLEKGQGIDFSTAEAMAFGSLMMEGYHVRLSGQDSGRVGGKTRF